MIVICKNATYLRGYFSKFNNLQKYLKLSLAMIDIVADGEADGMELGIGTEEK